MRERYIDRGFSLNCVFRLFLDLWLCVNYGVFECYGWLRFYLCRNCFFFLVCVFDFYFMVIVGLVFVFDTVFCFVGDF